MSSSSVPESEPYKIVKSPSLKGGVIVWKNNTRTCVRNGRWRRVSLNRPLGSQNRLLLQPCERCGYKNQKLTLEFRSGNDEDSNLMATVVIMFKERNIVSIKRAASGVEIIADKPSRVIEYSESNEMTLIPPEARIYAFLIMNDVPDGFGWTSSGVGGIIILPDEGFHFVNHENRNKAPSPLSIGMDHQQLVQMMRERQMFAAGRHQATAAAGSVKKQESISDCVICMDEKRTIACVPCGHVVYCEPCSKDATVKSMTTCPVCRKRVTSLMKVYV